MPISRNGLPYQAEGGISRRGRVQAPSPFRSVGENEHGGHSEAPCQMPDGSVDGYHKVEADDKVGGITERIERWLGNLQRWIRQGFRFSRADLQTPPL